MLLEYLRRHAMDELLAFTWVQINIQPHNCRCLVNKVYLKSLYDQIWNEFKHSSKVIIMVFIYMLYISNLCMVVLEHLNYCSLIKQQICYLFNCHFQKDNYSTHSKFHPMCTFWRMALHQMQHFQFYFLNLLQNSSFFR